MIMKLNIRHNVPKTSAYVKCYDGEGKWMTFLIRDDKLMKKHKKIQNKVTNSIKK